MLSLPHIRLQAEDACAASSAIMNGSPLPHAVVKHDLTGISAVFSVMHTGWNSAGIASLNGLSKGIVYNALGMLALLVQIENASANQQLQ